MSVDNFISRLRVLVGFKRRQWSHLLTRAGRLRSQRNSLQALHQKATAAGGAVEAIYLPEHIGDIVAAEPVSRRIKQDSAVSKVIWFVYEQHQEILSANPYVDLVVPIRCTGEYSSLVETGWIDRVHFCRIAPPKECSFCQLPLIPPPHARPLTALEYYSGRTLLQAFCANAGLPDLNIAPQLHLPASVVHSCRQLGLPDRFVCVHTTSNDPLRNWTRGHWQELAGWITREMGIPIVEVGMQPALEPSEQVRTDLCGKLTLAQSAAVVARASLFIGIDSGPAHFANAAGISRIALLGHFSAFPKYLPYSGDAAWLSNLEAIHWPTPAANIPVTEVVGRIQALRARRFPRNGG